MAAPLTPLECDLLEAVVDRRDEAAIAVLADYWIQHVDEDRGAFLMLQLGDNAENIDLADEERRLGEHAQRWRAFLIEAGWEEHDLTLLDGFLQFPLSMPENDPLDHHPDVVRISPRYFREGSVLCRADETQTIRCEAITPRTRTPAVIKAPFLDAEPDLEHEVRVLRLIDHPNVVRPFGFVARSGGARALAMPWAGIDLRWLLKLLGEHDTWLGEATAMSIGVQLLDGLSGVHAAGIVHRQIAPEHVAAAADGVARILGFSSATLPSYEPPDRFSRHRSELRYRLQYMSPEQVRGHRLDGATDVFAAAIVIVELVTRRNLILGEHPPQSDFELLERIAHQPFEIPTRVSGHLRATLAAALVHAREQRPTATDLRDAITACACQMRVEIGPHVIARRFVELGIPA